MRNRILFVVVFLLLAFVLRAERQFVTFETMDWKINHSGVETTLDNIDEIQVGSVFIGTSEIENQEQANSFLHLYKGANFFLVEVNGETVQNELSCANVFADISSLVQNGEFEIRLTVKQTISKLELNRLLEYSTISSVSDVFIKNFSLFEDQFFGGKGLNVKVASFAEKDVDGKLIASVIDMENGVEVVRNNNCAFARVGMEFDVEINFPEAENIHPNSTYLVHVALVDKGRNEEVIDEIEMPLFFD